MTFLFPLVELEVEDGTFKWRLKGNLRAPSNGGEQNMLFDLLPIEI
jgi:hypothetical protein